MTDITADMVKELRDRTDAPIMNCKKALIETNGDINQAERIVREAENDKLLSSLFLNFDIKNKKNSTPDLKVSANGSCPECQSNDWKSPQMMHLTGLTYVNSTTKGSENGLGIGIGRGRGGIDITSSNYQESSLGLQQSELSRRFSPPKESLFSESKQQLVDEIKLNMSAEENRLELKDSDKGWWPKNIIDVYRGRIADALNKINELDEYEKQKLIWDKARICQRCGTEYFDKNH